MDNRISGLPPPRRSYAQRHMPVKKPKDMKGTLHRLWHLTKGHRKGVPVLFLLSAFASVSAMVTPLLVGKCIDSADAGHIALELVLALLLVYLGDWAIRFFQKRLSAAVSQRLVCFLRKSLFAVMKTLPLSFYDKNLHGDLMSRLTNDIDNISTAISDSLTQFMMLGFTLSGILILMFSLNPFLAMVVLTGMPLVFLLTKWITSHTRRLYRQQQEALGALSGYMEETVSGLALVKAYGREALAIGEFEAKNEALCQAGTRSLIWSGFLMPLMNVVNNLCFIFVSVASGLLAARGLAGVGIISAFLLYSRQFTRPLNELASLFNTFQSAVAGAERIFEVFDKMPEPPDLPEALPLSHPRGEFVFENVQFGYEPGRLVLDGISFRVKPGECIAVIGPTGAGKTTLISLLARFYDVSGGRILLDGHDLREYRLKDLRACFGIVLQDTALLEASIRENIRYGHPEATDSQVEQAAILAGADDFIRQLPGEYDAMVEENGNAFSQGERQLLTVARAILADAPILILDEATSSVDSRTEQHIREAVRRLTQNRTSFLIAHRLSTIRDADRILVIDQGKAAEWGTHEELLALNGIYAQMYRIQRGMETQTNRKKQ